MAVAEKPAEAKITEERERIAVHNPVTGETIASIPVSDEAAVTAAVERARAAQPAWGALSPKARARLMRRWADMLWDDQKNAMRIVREETGKNDTGAWIEVFILDNLVSYYYHHAPKLLRPQKRRTLFPFIQKARVFWKAHGVVGAITPWNYPLTNALLDVVPALFAGNAVILKPSEVAPFSAGYAVSLMHQAGIPEGVIQVVHGDGRTGRALVDQVDYVAFTGSTAVGREVGKRAAERLIPHSLELGGKDPLIVMADADIEQAASGVLRGALENAGQVCVSTERVYVEEPIYDQFVERLRHWAEKLTVGNEGGFEVHVGSMTSEREMLRAENHIKNAVEKGAAVIYGGDRRPDLGPYFLEPTILVNVDHTMDIMQEETFGPLIPIMRVRDVDEALRLANDSEYGLSGAIFTRDLKRGEALATRIDSGDVSINRPQFVAGTPSLPWGGQKNSGIGRRGGPEGLMRFVAPQSILTDSLRGSLPALGHIDPITLRLILLLRRIRRYVSFI